MEIYVGKTAGFCLGVSNAVEVAKNKLEEIQSSSEVNKIYCLGEMVHNKQVVNSFENKGMITVNSIEEIPDNKTVFFRAHGEAKKVYDRAKEKNLKIIDLTCGKVKAIHVKVEREVKEENSFIIILGKKSHPEIIGTKGFAGENCYVVETEDDILDAYMEYEKTSLGRVYVVAQTTFSSKLFDEIAKEIETNFIEADVIIDKTICDATELRQAETMKMTEKFHNMIVIGGKNSSNTKELVNVAQRNGNNVYSIETVEEIKDVDFSNIESIGIMAGASTPQESIEEVKNFLECINKSEN